MRVNLKGRPKGEKLIASQKLEIRRKLEGAQASLRAGNVIDGAQAFEMLDEHHERFKAGAGSGRLRR